MYKRESLFIIIHSGWSLACIFMKERVNWTYDILSVSPLVKSVYQKNFFLISQQKHIL